MSFTAPGPQLYMNPISRSPITNVCGPKLPRKCTPVTGLGRLGLRGLLTTHVCASLQIGRQKRSDWKFPSKLQVCRGGLYHLQVNGECRAHWSRNAQIWFQIRHKPELLVILPSGVLSAHVRSEEWLCPWSHQWVLVCSPCPLLFSGTAHAVVLWTDVDVTNDPSCRVDGRHQGSIKPPKTKSCTLCLHKAN